MKFQNLRFTLLTISVFSLSACKVASDKDSPKPTSAILGYFVTQQSAFSGSIPYNQDFTLRDIWSYFFGRLYLTPEDASVQNVLAPPMGCHRSSTVGEASFTINNIMDPGTLTLIGNNGQLDIPRYEEDISFQLVGFLGFGDLRLRSTGKNSSLSFDQSFRIPNPGMSLKISSGTHVDQVLPSPLINDASIVHVERSAGLRLSYLAPTGASYVRVTLGDADNPDSNIVCFAPAEGPVDIEAAHLERFGITDRGSLRVDFVNVSFRNDILRIKENMIVSNSFHLHGVHINPFIQDREFHFGALSFE